MIENVFDGIFSVRIVQTNNWKRERIASMLTYDPLDTDNNNNNKKKNEEPLH
jgi:hypothetical protein